MLVDAETEVPAATLAAALGVSRKRVEQLAADGVVKRVAKGRFLLLQSVTGFITWLRDEQRAASKSASAGRFQEARAADIEARTAERQKRLKVEASEHALAVIDEFGGQLKADLLAMPSRWTTDIALRRKMEDAIDAALGVAGKRALTEANKDGSARPDRPPATRRRR